MLERCGNEDFEGCVQPGLPVAVERFPSKRGFQRAGVPGRALQSRG